jgi:predicted aspartyl protease
MSRENRETVMQISGKHWIIRRKWIGAFVSCLVTAGAGNTFAQGAISPSVPAQETSRPDTERTSTGISQQSEQVHTGTASGLSSEARLEALLADHQFLRIENQLAKMPPEQAQFYRGILANRDNDPKKSIELLAPLVEKVAASGNRAEEKLLRKALAEDYLRSGEMAKAAAAYAALAEQTHLTAEEQEEIELPLKLAPLAAANPPMTVEPYGPFLLQVSRNPLGLTELPVYVDARPHSWMMDPTAPLNLIARSEAKEAGLKVSAESATIHSLTGRPMVVHMTVIPRFTLGGRITFRNMTAFVFEDADYAFPRSQFQVEGLLGYPALSALGSLTVTSDATIEVRPFKPMLATEKEDPPTAGARFYLDGEQMIVALGAKGQESMFAVDASGQQTYLTSRYYDEHMDDFNGMKMALFSIPGAETKPPQPAYLAETMRLTIGPAEVEAHSIQVITAPVGLAALDDVYGVLGMDFLEQMRSYTFDYRTMRFGVRAE